MSSNEIKLVIIGDSGIGKTSIIKRISEEKFSEDYESTIGAQYSSITLQLKEGKKLKIGIWDTAGQEEYKSMVNIFYQGAAIALMVYDISRRETFENIKNSWYNLVINNTPENIILGVVGNKSDIINMDNVTEEEGQKWANEINAEFSITSAKLNTGINEIFDKVGTKFLSVVQQGTRESSGKLDFNFNDKQFKLKQQNKKNCCQ